jgi:hypothetical protein
MTERPPKPPYRFTGTEPPAALAHLADKPVWITWDYVWKPDKGEYGKPPHSGSTGRMQKDWPNADGFAVPFARALATMRRRGLSGLGLSLGPASLVGADLDDCITDAGSYSALAAELVSAAETYCEVSPSGTGIHFLGLGTIAKAIPRKDLGIELYATGRYFTLTGNQVDGTPGEIRPAPRLIARLVKLDAETPKPGKTNGVSSVPLTRETARGGDFFSNVNAAALANLDKWVPTLHPTAKKQATGAWRVSSAHLGRGLEEDLSYHPEGIQDFGREGGLSPIDAVQEFGDASKPVEAARWLCGQLGVEPASLGWGKATKREKPPAEAPAQAYAGPSRTVDEVVALFQRWLYLPDPGPVYAVLGTVRANLLPGRPVWLAVVGPPSSAKTEIINALALLPFIHPATALSPAALLSGTPKKQRAQDAKGGLLKQIGEHGIITQKDLGSVLSARPDDRAEAFAALRELYDGAWTRDLGTDGGRQLKWKGKVGLIVGSTEAVDSHADSMAQLGERLAFYRLPGGAREQLAYARLQAGDGAQRMERELREGVAGLFKDLSYVAEPVTPEEEQTLQDISWRAVRLRSAVVRDRRTREIEAVHGTEGPARLFLMLERLFIGIASLEADRETAMAVVKRVAMDSVPPMRRKALEFIEGAGAKQETRAVAQHLGLPTLQAKRVLEDLAARQLVARESQGQGKSDVWGLHGEPNPQNTLWGSGEVLDAAE